MQSLCDSTQGLTAEQRAQLRALCEKYLGAFNAGDRPLAISNLTTFSLEVSASQRPVSCAPRPVSYEKRAIIAKIVDDGIKEGIIAPSTSEWASAVVLVKMPSGDSRLCVDGH